jgi:hypothetical protein
MNELLRCPRCGATVEALQYRCSGCKRVLEATRGDAASALCDAVCAVALVVGALSGIVVTCCFVSGGNALLVMENLQRRLASNRTDMDALSILIILGAAFFSAIFVLSIGKKR